MTVTAPLEDPTYRPKYPPVDGRIPAVVERWGPRSQVRWFRRFGEQLGSRPVAVWDRYYVDSVAHRGLCCTSCLDDEYEGYGGYSSGCCCKAKEVGS